jgi:hypothetical protein
MFSQRSAVLALLVANFAPAATAIRDLKVDFDWNIQPQDGFPVIAFNNLTTTKEVIFQYDSPLLNENENKTYAVTIFESDCKTIGSNAITNTADASVDRELTVLVDVDQGTISNSLYYESVNLTNAIIGLCLRVDYLWNEDSINFHETNVTINVDLTAGFELTNVQQMRTGASQDQVIVDIDYPVIAYHCNAVNDKLAVSPDLTQGSAMQLCVELDPTSDNDDVYVTDILSADLHQQKTDLSVANREIIEEAIPDFFTSKNCQGGICNIKTQLDSSWFSDSIPGDINATGVAILAFGSISTGTQRFLRAPIVFQQRGSAGDRELARKLQQGDEETSLAEFSLSTSLKKPSDDDKTPPVLFICIAILVSLFNVCCIIGLLACVRRRKGTAEQEESVIVKSELVPELGSMPTDETSQDDSKPSDDKPGNEEAATSEEASEEEETETPINKVYDTVEEEGSIIITSELVPEMKSTPPDKNPSHSKPPHSEPPHSEPPHSMPPHSMPPHSMPPHSKPLDVKPSDVKPSYDKPSDEKPSDEKPSDDKPPHSKPPHSKPSGDTLSDGKPPHSKPSDDKASAGKPPHSKPSDDKPVAENAATSPKASKKEKRKTHRFL